MKLPCQAPSLLSMVLLIIAFAIGGISLPARSNLLEFTPGSPCQVSGDHSRMGVCADRWDTDPGAFAIQWT